MTRWWQYLLAVLAGLAVSITAVVALAAATIYPNLPSLETLQVLEGYTLLRTDENGWIELTTDGEQMWVEVERK